MAITITLTGDQAKLDVLVPMYARAHGWVDGAVDGNGDPITAIQAAQDAIIQYFIGIVNRQGVKEAQDIAADQALSSIASSVDGLTIAVTEV